MATTASFASFADAYNVEVSAGYINGSAEPDDYPEFDTDLETKSLSGRFYFSEQNSSTGPLAEVSFLNQASSFGLVADNISFQNKGDDFDEESLYKHRVIDTRFVLDNKYIIKADYQTFEDADDKEMFEAYSLGFGMYLDSSTDLVFTYSDVDDGDKLYQLDLHKLISLNNSTALAVDAGFDYIDVGSEGDNYRVLNLAASYYITPALDLNIKYEHTNDDDYLVNQWSLGLGYFVTENVQFKTNYQVYNSQYMETKELGAEVLVRF